MRSLLFVLYQPETHSNRHGDFNHFRIPDTHGYAVDDVDGHVHANRHSNRDGNRDGNPDADRDVDSDANPHRNGDFDADGHGNRDAHCHADLRAFGRYQGAGG